jgi:NAD(P)-dependent dehydrogenase (short-subunit alcohol dehydrogenase family)
MSGNEQRFRTAIVTGGSGAIGTACARALIARDYDVVLTARSEAPLELAADSMGARWVAADCADPGSFSAVVKAAGRVDLLVHAAGILRGTFVRKEQLADFDAVIRTNLRSCLVTTQAVLPAMGVGSRIVFISSSASTEPMQGRTAYSAVKAGLNAFAAALGREVERDGINVNVLIPAPVESPMLAGVTFDMHAITPDDVAAALIHVETAHPAVVLGPVSMRAHTSGPLAPAPVRPARSPS